MTTDTPAPEDAVAATTDVVRALSVGRSALVIGATDRGKTTLVGAVAQSLSAELERVAVVDTDIGQSEIGPPGTVGVAWANVNNARLHDLRPAALYFAGACTPRAAALEWVSASAAAMQWALRHGAERILVDTPGDVDGPAARRLFTALGLAIAPDVLLMLSLPDNPNADGAAALAALTATTSGARVFRVPASGDAQRKPDTRRRLVRRTRLFAALENGITHRFPILSTSEGGGGSVVHVPTRGTSLGVGRTVAPHLCRWIGDALPLPTSAATGEIRAVIDGGVLTVFAPPGRSLPSITPTSSGVVAQHFGVSMVRLVSMDTLIGACVGLIGDGGQTLAIGRFEGLAPGTGDAIVFTGLRGADRVRLLQFGRFRLSREGEFQGDIRAGET